MGLRAIMVAVDYADLLAVTLPYNRHHFEEVWIITDEKSYGKVSAVAWPDMLPENGPKVLVTDLFYADGAVFNKWRALEWGLDQMGRYGWIVLMDTDVLWPKDLEVRTELERGAVHLGPGKYDSRFKVQFGQLCTPLRRMAPWPPPPHADPHPPEHLWRSFPVHRNVGEWAGYSQIFHADDPVLGPPPWHETNWRHCGGADSFFQMKWPRERKVRPPFECLHLGPAGENWMGRATPYADGTMPPEAAERRRLVQGIWEGRQTNRVRHGPNSDVYRDEKLS